MKLYTNAFAVTFGLIWGFGLFFLTWWIMLFDGATREKTTTGRIYRGYNISPIGSLWGLLWGFFDGLAGGACFAWLYNTCVKLFGKLEHHHCECKADKLTKEKK
jgi:hypothetical protein